jgi:hypothetical protein
MARVAWPPLPAWVESLQGAFADTLRRPLDRSSGTLRARTDGYDASLVAATTAHHLSAAERLAVYNRQYWMRLFTVLHGAYPLVARLLGYWELNRWAEPYLLQHPPRTWDIDAIVPGFEPFLKAALPREACDVAQPPRTLPTLAVLQAATIDAAHHRVFRAPQDVAYQPAPSEGAALLQSQLRFVSSAALLTESWPLHELRHQALAMSGEQQLPLGEALPRPRTWLLMRHELAMGLFALEPREAELLELLQVRPVAAALAQLEDQCSTEERARLPEQTRAWLARSVRLGLWARPTAR